MDMATQHLNNWQVLRNWIRRTCPHCGRGSVLDGWVTTRDRCSECGLVFQKNPGDTWAFWILGDRIPVVIALAAVYFGLRPHTWLQVTLFFGTFATMLVATIPQRMGFIVALHYLSRRCWPDEDDPIPSVVPSTDPAKAA
jgi:uncharacterized protein (DUF983 family)